MNKILFIDTVTTGMNCRKCGIYKLGGILITDGKEKERIELNIRPFNGADISTGSIAVSGTTLYEISKYPKENEAFADFMSFLTRNVDLFNPNDKIYLAGFNSAAFDYPFIREWFLRMNNQRFRDIFHVQTIDIMCLSAFCLMEERTNMPDFHLETAATFLGVTPTKNAKYSCIDNAKTCLDMYRALRRRMNLPDTTDGKESGKIFRNF